MTRWRQFSLRTFLLAVTLLGMALSWIAAKRAQTARENAAADYLYQRDVHLDSSGDRVHPRTGLAKLILGDNPAAQFRDAHLNKPKIVDDDLARVRDLPNLKFVILGENLTDLGLEHLRGHPSICCLFIDGGRITDDGLVVLQSLPRLKEVFLWRTPITGSGLIHLRGMSLDHLDICQSPIRDEHLRHLQQLKYIEKLHIGDTPITDAGLVHLHSIKTLREVNLTMCPVTEEGVDALLAANPDLIVLDRFRPRGTRVITY